MPGQRFTTEPLWDIEAGPCPQLQRYHETPEFFEARAVIRNSSPLDADAVSILLEISYSHY
jgi:hypothetical protein